MLQTLMIITISMEYEYDLPSSTAITALESPLLATYSVRPFIYTATHVHPDVI